MTTDDLYFQKMRCSRPCSLIFLVFATCTVLPVSTLSITGSDVLSMEAINGNDVVSMPARSRTKRIPMYSALKGAEIVKKLLRGATQIDLNNKNIRVFKKFGTFRSAIDDFKALNPSNFHSSSTHVYQNTVVSGRVGDRFIVIERRGNTGLPTMSIKREKEGVYDHTDTIIYTDKPTS